MLGRLWGWFSLWLREVERRVAVVKAAVKWALTWSARGRAAGKGLVGLAWALQPWAWFKAPLAWLADGRLSPLAALGLSDTERPAFAQSVPTARVGEGGWFSRWFAVKWR